MDALLVTYRGLVQGLYYGSLVRLPHAAVMTLLFSKGSLRAKVRTIATLTFLHARNLAAFVALYKALTAALARVSGGRAQWHSLLAGGAGGWVVWAHYGSVNFQIVLYLVSRVLLALVRLAAQRRLLGPLSDVAFPQAYPWLATGTWALVLWLYEHHGELLHPSLYASMVTLYRNADRTESWRDLVPSPAAAAVLAYMLASHWHEPNRLVDLSAKLL